MLITLQMQRNPNDVYELYKKDLFYKNKISYFYCYCFFFTDTICQFLYVLSVLHALSHVIPQQCYDKALSLSPIYR